MYRLRAKVDIEASDLVVSCGIGDKPKGAYDDPRHVALGWRHYGLPHDAQDIDWIAIYVANGIPQTGVELIANDSYILESGFERLNGVDFRKGCYVGQEITARMKHKTELRKGLAVVSIKGSAPVGTEITANDKSVGKLFSQSGGQAIAYLRFDRATGPMSAGDATITYAK
jgi:folate-binding protein YgfZ